jgi:phenylpyruvate tautomerase PptA (4-oxalocrotonate tautomerase family)
MPTYVCSVPNGKLSDLQNQEIAISNRHSEATGAPPVFVQVVVEEQGTSKRYLGGTATDNHIWIRGDIRAGRNEKQRGQIMLSIMNDVSRITGNPIDDIWVYLCNLARLRFQIITCLCLATIPLQVLAGQPVELTAVVVDTTGQ